MRPADCWLTALKVSIQINFIDPIYSYNFELWVSNKIVMYCKLMCYMCNCNYCQLLYRNVTEVTVENNGVQKTPNMRSSVCWSEFIMARLWRKVGHSWFNERLSSLHLCSRFATSPSVKSSPVTQGRRHMLNRNSWCLLNFTGCFAVEGKKEEDWGVSLLRSHLRWSREKAHIWQVAINR